MLLPSLAIKLRGFRSNAYAEQRITIFETDLAFLTEETEFQPDQKQVQKQRETKACGNSLTDARFSTSQFDLRVALLNLSSLAGGYDTCTVMKVTNRGSHQTFSSLD